jgi:putative transposase
MSRPLRIQYPGAIYHITDRGNEQKSIFRDDEDRLRFLDILTQSVKTYQVRVHCFVLMSNHFHLLVETPLGNLGDFMRHFTITYTSYFNRQHNRCGHLYQGRYKSLLIEKDAYFSSASRYIHLNPVRVNDIRKKTIGEQLDVLWNYQWSSLPGYRDTKGRYEFVEYGYILEEFGGDTLAGRRAYTKQIESDVAEGLSIKDKIIGQSLLGGDGFVSWVSDKFLKGVKDRERPAVGKVYRYGAKDEILKAAAEVLEMRPEELIKTSGITRYISMDLLYRFGGLNNREIGDLFGVDYSTVSQSRKRLRQGMKHDEELQCLFRKIERLLSPGCYRTLQE